MIIDVHTHVGDGNDNKTFTADNLIASMDEANIDYSIIIAERTAAGKLSRIESILQVTEKNPRLKAVVDCHFESLDLAQINEIISLLDSGKVLGVKFYIGYEQYYPYNERLFPIYEYCQKNGKPVIFHTGIMEWGGTGLLKYAHPLTIDEVAALFPNLKIIMAHMGNPWLLDAAAVMSKNKNVYADMSGFFEEEMPISHDDIVVFKERMLDAELFLGSYDKFLFGTDWPLYNQKEYIGAINALDLDPREKDLVFWKNAVKLFNLKI